MPVKVLLLVTYTATRPPAPARVLALVLVPPSATMTPPPLSEAAVTHTEPPLPPAKPVLDNDAEADTTESTASARASAMLSRMTPPPRLAVAVALCIHPCGTTRSHYCEPTVSV